MERTTTLRIRFEVKEYILMAIVAAALRLLNLNAYERAVKKGKRPRPPLIPYRHFFWSGYIIVTLIQIFLPRKNDEAEKLNFRLEYLEDELNDSRREQLSGNRSLVRLLDLLHDAVLEGIKSNEDILNTLRLMQEEGPNDEAPSVNLDAITFGQPVDLDEEPSHIHVHPSPDTLEGESTSLTAH